MASSCLSQAFLEVPGIFYTTFSEFFKHTTKINIDCYLLIDEGHLFFKDYPFVKEGHNFLDGMVKVIILSATFGGDNAIS